jgi:phospholipase C
VRTRREFFKQAAKLSGGAKLLSALLPSIERASAIDPPQGSTFMDAEHVVILMQENRSFDHVYGRLRGVRGFNDPEQSRSRMVSPSGCSRTPRAKPTPFPSGPEEK